MANAVRQSSLTTYGENAAADPVASRVGITVVEDFWLHMMFLGKVYQVRAGTITTPLVGDVVLTDTAAEVAINALAAGLIIPASMQISVRLGTGTLHEYAVKSVAGAWTGGTAFVPLPLRSNGGAATATASVSAAGGVTVPAEAVTTTRRHWEFANPVAAGAGDDPGNVARLWEPRTPPIVVGASTLYVQIAATGTGPSYYMHLDFLDDPTSTLL